MVKRSRDQSHDAPRRRNCCEMIPPDSAFHSHTRFRNASRPMARRSVLFSFWSNRSTTIWVAMPGMVGAGLPQHIAPAHPLEADQDILDGIVERMAHVERARHVGRWDHDGEGFSLGLGSRA